MDAVFTLNLSRPQQSQEVQRPERGPRRESKQPGACVYKRHDIYVEYPSESIRASVALPGTRLDRDDCPIRVGSGFIIYLRAVRLKQPVNYADHITTKTGDGHDYAVLKRNVIIATRC